MKKKRFTRPEIDKLFAVNSISFKRDFLPVYEKHFTPKYLVQFPILLPYHMPFKNGTCVTLINAKNSACTYHFYAITTVHHVSASVLTPDSIKVPIHKTRVEMIFVTDKKIRKSEKLLTDVFDMLLEGLNLVLIAYQIQTKDIDVHRISKEMIQFGSMYRIIPVQRWHKFIHGLFLVHFDVPYSRGVLSKEITEKIIWYANVINQQWNPFMLSEEFALGARRNIKDGFYKESVLYAQMSIETFLRALFVQLLLSEGKVLAEAESINENIPFMQMVKREFNIRLGGRWNAKSVRSKLGRWYKCTYRIRNKIVHTGYSPTYSETKKALSAAGGFRSYVISLTKRQKKKYPDLEKFFITHDHN